ncbi:MAG: TlpA family protein disulfide reductase [Bacteroidales bacterium]|nr:TlpA family protein disulfide reductase [Bacteroidales bacterium]
MKNSTLFAIIVWMSLSVFASQNVQAQQPVTIKGTLPGAEGKTIHLMITSDYLVENETLSQKTTVKNDGTFSFDVIVDAIAPVTLSVNFYTFTFFVAPGENYLLTGKNIVFDNNINPFIIKPSLPLTLSEPDPLNRFLMQFEQKRELFEMEKYQDIFNSQNLSAFDALWMPVDALPEKYQKFCTDYQTYTIGALKANYSKKRSLKLGTTYLGKEKPDISNYCYMLFFNTFFDEYLPYHSNEIVFPVLQQSINKAASLSEISDILKKDPVFLDDELRMLFLVKLLEQYPFRESSVKKLLNDIVTSKPSEQIAKAAQDVLRQTNTLQPRTTAPAFAFPNVAGKMVKSETLKGKYLYINFFKTNCYDCLAEMELMKDLYNKNNRFIEFVSICLDNDADAFQTFSKNHQYPWTLLYAGYEQEFILQWQAKIIPYYILIDKEYKIISCPAPSPIEDIRHTLEKISWEEQRRQRGR